MKYIKTTYQSITGILIVLTLTSCYDEPDWLGDNTTPGIGSFPVAAFITGNEDSYDEGDLVEFQLQYWSDEEMDVINVYSTIGSGEQNLESTTPFTPN